MAKGYKFLACTGVCVCVCAESGDSWQQIVDSWTGTYENGDAHKIFIAHFSLR